MKIEKYKKLPAHLGEKAQYLARESNDCTIRLSLSYQGAIDEVVLKKATIELIQRIDILHASFHAGTYRAKWIVNPEFNSEEVFSYHKVQNNFAESVNKAMLKTIPFDGMVQMHCALIKDENQSVIIINVGHMCADGKDALYLAEKLIELYNCILDGRNPVEVELKNGRRDPEQCCKGLSFHDRVQLYHKPPIKNKTEYVYADKTEGASRIICKTLSEEMVSRIRKEGKKYHASINDLLLTAFYRATAKQMELNPGEGMGIQAMMDLRRRMPNGDSLGVCNLSGSMSTELEEGVKGNFVDTLIEIVEQTTKIKNDPLSGLYDFPMMSGIFRVFSFSMIQRLGAMVYGSATMGMTNLGALKAEKFKIGGMLPNEAIFGAPLKHKPAFQLAAIGLNGSITISSVAVCTKKDEKAILELMNELEKELIAFCELAEEK